MAKMLWETYINPTIAKIKEDFGLNNLWKYLRYYKMYLERFSIYHDKVNLTKAIEEKLLWSGRVAIVKDKVNGELVACQINGEKYDRNKNTVEVNVSAENGFSGKYSVGTDCVVMYADETHIPPVLYLWAIANEVVDIEDIIKTQNNMLRKPILVDGVGEDLDNAVVKVSNLLSGVAFMNRKKGKSRDKSTMMDNNEIEVLNLQVGNAYKGEELLTMRKHKEELICDYLGYGTTKNEKRERMNLDEVNLENSIGNTFYKSAVRLHEDMIKEVKEVLGIELRFVKNLEPEKETEVKEDVSNKTKME